MEGSPGGRERKPKGAVAVGSANVRQGGSAQKIDFSKKSHKAENCRTVPKIVAQCRKGVVPHLYTLRRTIAYAYTLRNAKAYLNTCTAYTYTCITYFNTLTRLSAPYLNTCILIH